jgi:hypothetical protein
MLLISKHQAGVYSLFFVKAERHVWCISYMLGPCDLYVCRIQGNWWTTWKNICKVTLQIWKYSYECLQSWPMRTSTAGRSSYSPTWIVHIACFPHIGMSALYLLKKGLFNFVLLSSIIIMINEHRTTASCGGCRCTNVKKNCEVITSQVVKTHPMFG